MIRVAASLLSLAQIIEHCLYPSMTPGVILRQENWERATHSRKIMFKTEKVVRSTCLKAAKSGLWDISPSPTENGKPQRDFIELSVFIAV